MANPNQNIIFLEQAYDELKSRYFKFQDDSQATNMEIKIFLMNFLGFGKKIM